MADKFAKKAELSARRRRRARKKISGTAARPRLSVTKSTRHVYVQVIDDESGRTLVAASSFETGNHRRASKTVCEEVGRAAAERCKTKNIEQIVFDRGGNAYHGRVQAVAEGAREGGLIF